MKIPLRIQHHLFCSKIALYKQRILNVQNNNNGTSGVELNDIIEIKIVDTSKIILLASLFLDRKREANL
tara:strand:- start:10 stop:216 length:207 start_codon:yes stop_codon:yes gene_type:complete